jgi:hypothetical protein
MILHAADWPDAARFYARLRRIRMALELGEPQPRASVLAALGGPSTPPTLVGYRHAGKRAGFLVESYSIWGYSGLSPADLDSKRLAASPVYDAHLIPVSEADDDVPPLVRSIVHVRVGLVVFPESAPESWSLYAWIPEDPGSGYRQIMSDIDQLSEKQIFDLKRAADSLIRVPNTGGRPVLETRLPELADKYVTAAESFLTDCARAPRTMAEFAEFLDMSDSTLRDHLNDTGLGPWSQFKADNFSDLAVGRAHVIRR